MNYSTYDFKDSTVGNSVYKYQLRDNKLINSKKLLELTSLPRPAHNGGKIRIGPDKNVYFTVGHLNDMRHVSIRIRP